MRRDEWVFSYNASNLAAAAAQKRDHHKQRFDWWTLKKEETIRKVKEMGIEVHDSVAASISNTKGYAGPRIEIDAGLQRDLSECQGKIREHDESMREYEGWRQVLESNKEDRLQLNHDDWLYFFGQ